jgi:hypothetical protein
MFTYYSQSAQLSDSDDEIYQHKQQRLGLFKRLATIALIEPHLFDSTNPCGTFDDEQNRDSKKSRTTCKSDP